MAKFKKGDKVRCVYGCLQLTEGGCFTVKRTYSDILGYDYVNVSDSYGNEIYGAWDESRFELVEETKYALGEYTTVGGCKAVVLEEFDGYLYGRVRTGLWGVARWDALTGFFLSDKDNALNLPPLKKEEPKKSCDGKTVVVDGVEYILKEKTNG